MILQLQLGIEGHETMGTLERLVFHMLTLVRMEVGHLGKRFRTGETAVRFLAGVDSFVLLHMAQLGEFPITESTRIRFDP